MNAQIITHATRDGCRVPTPDERRAHWASKYFGCGHHRVEWPYQLPDEPDHYTDESYAREQDAV